MNRINKIINDQDFLALSAFVKKTIADEVGEVWLYGSRARGDSSAKSDWDLMILLNKGISFDHDFDKYAYPLVEFGWGRGMNISPILYSRQEWEKRSISNFYHNVLRDRIRLC